jgi:hypothetical protein
VFLEGMLANYILLRIESLWAQTCVDVVVLLSYCHCRGTCQMFREVIIVIF